jgi:hypothetical protein
VRLTWHGVFGGQTFSMVSPFELQPPALAHARAIIPSEIAAVAYFVVPPPVVIVVGDRPLLALLAPEPE